MYCETRIVECSDLILLRKRSEIYQKSEINMIDFNILKHRREIFARVTGVKLEDFYKIIEKVRPSWNKLQSSKQCHGRSSNLKSLENEILLVLIYYRCYISHFLLGMYFNLDASNVCRHLKRLEPLIARAIHIKKDRTLSYEELDTILIDATEIQTQRPTKHQRKFYSGKKKKHTQKLETMISLEGKIVNISKVYPGRVHDFKIRKFSDKVPRDVTILADSGYQGLQKLHKKTILPYKRRRRCPLTPEQRAHNRKLSSKRVTIEHVFAHLKKFQILSSIYRNFQKKLHMRVNIIAGIYNLKFA